MLTAILCDLGVMQVVCRQGSAFDDAVEIENGSFFTTIQFGSSRSVFVLQIISNSVHRLKIHINTENL